ncbi:MAG: hypothetical protein U0S36_10790 [Candidatus Nanopelagicales bacterium]
MAASRADDVMRDWHPGWMGAVLGTAGSAVVALADPLPDVQVDTWIGTALTVIAAVLAPALLLPYVVRHLRHREAALADLSHPGLGPLYGTIPASALALAIALAQLGVLGSLPASVSWVVAGLLVLGVAGAVLVGVPFFAGVVAREQVPAEALTGAWFIPAVVLVLVPSVVIRLVVLQPGWRGGTTALVAAGAVGAGLMLFLLLAPALVWRLISAPAPAPGQAATWWIWLAPAGAGGLGVLATARLVAAGLPTGGEAIVAVGLLVATGLWGFALWWVVLAARVLVRARHEIRFHVGSWGFVFPTAALTALTIELGRTWDSSVVQVLGLVGFAATLITWAGSVLLTFRGLRRGDLVGR